MDNGYSETFATYEFVDKGTYVCNAVAKIKRESSL